MTFEELHARALEVAKPRELAFMTEAGVVGAALLTEGGHVYLGANIDTACSMGFCAEHSAAAAMVTAGEQVVKKMVAVSCDDYVIPPCGRCRQFIAHLATANLDCEVLVAKDKILKLRDLLPYDWRESLQ